MKKVLFILSLVAGIAIFDSCAPGRYTVTARPDVPVYVRPASPGANYVWVDGDWYWRGGRYTYRNGYWARPRGGRAWVGGAWVGRGNGYYWRRGHWR